MASVAIEWRQAIVRGTRDLTHDVRLFEIEPAGVFVVPTPGAHINIGVQIDGRADKRSYSLVGPCTDGVYRIAVKLLPTSRGGSRYMWSLREGARLTISTPGNHFDLGRNKPAYLLIAGGIGITPIYSMALALAQQGANFNMVYSCRSQRDLALGDELRATIGDRLRIFFDEEGARPDLAREFAALAPGGEVYICGPMGMLEAAKHAWRDSGKPADHLRFETFGNSGRFATVPFTVKIPRLSIEIEVPPNRSMLEAIEAAGVEMIFDCRRGECGLCALPILHADGIVDHRDFFFSDEEKAANTKLCTCVSRLAGGVLTIDTADRAVI